MFRPDKVSCKGSTKFLIEMGERTAADDLRKGVAVSTRCDIGLRLM
jgi:hypothetical protein